MPDENDANDPSGKHEGTIQALDPLTAIAVTALFGLGGNLAGSGVKTASAAVLQYMNDEGPIAFRVLGSWTASDRCVAALSFMNLTAHGAYVERIRFLDEPIKIHPFTVFHKATKTERSLFGFHSDDDKQDDKAGKKKKDPIWADSDEGFPFYIAPLGSYTIFLRMNEDATKLMSARTVANLEFDYSVTGGSYAGTQPAKCKKRGVIRLRNSGPALPLRTD